MKMSANGHGQPDLWQKMLLDFDQLVEFWLNEMHSTEPNLLFDDEFEKMFSRILIDR